MVGFGIIERKSVILEEKLLFQKVNLLVGVRSNHQSIRTLFPKRTIVTIKKKLCSVSTSPSAVRHDDSHGLE